MDNAYHALVCQWILELGILYAEEYPIGPYSLDIYLPELTLAIEVDGPSHALSSKKDRIRDEYCRAHGIETVRIKAGTPKQDVVQIISEIIGAWQWR